jgi:general stress protein YciG
MYMAGTTEGGRIAAKKNKAKHGVDFYARIGAMGGKKGHTGGFYANRDLARSAGAKGGQVSRRKRTDASKSEE